MSKSNAAEKTAARQPKFEKVETDHGTFRKGTIRHRVYEFLTLPKSKAMTKAEMVSTLAKEFPDSTEEQLSITVGFSFWDFERKLSKFKVGRDDAGRYNVNIEGRSTARVAGEDVPSKPAKKTSKKTSKKPAKKPAKKQAAKAEKKKDTRKKKTIRAGLTEILPETETAAA